MTIRIVYGPNDHQNLTIESGSSVQDVFNELGPIFGIPGGLDVRVNGVDKTYSCCVENGDVIEFVKKSGSKS
jgi:hypothetical protein